MWIRDSYDIPDEVSRGPHSPAFAQFLSNWFGDTTRITHGELDLGFLADLTPEELALAREMVRRNLKLRHNHIIQGVSALHDVAAAPILKSMLDTEPSESRRLTIAGALWKLTRDPVFPECLEQAKASGNQSLLTAHLNQVLWLDDSRAIDFLIDLLPERDHESLFWRVFQRLSLRWPWRRLLFRKWAAHRQRHAVGFYALALLNRLEFDAPAGAPPREAWRLPSEYRKLSNDLAFRERMTAFVHKWNVDVKNEG